MIKIRLNPLTVKKIKSFRAIKRGYYSLIALLIMLFFSMLAEFFINSNALVVKYEGEYYFPVISNSYQGKDFGQNISGPANYKDLAKQFEKNQNSDNYVIMPLVPYNPYEQDFSQGQPPLKPSLTNGHILGTDIIGRDILARLVYGFRIAIVFALVVMAITYTIAVIYGCAMGYFGGKFDLFSQRIVEIWSMIPTLYVIMILVSILKPTLMLFIGITVFFGWTGMTWYMRTLTYRERTRDYVMAARALGASTWRILFKHILPNTMVMIVTIAPFTIAGLITTLTSLDYLGLGLLPPTPSWGELLKQGKDHLEAPWILISVVTSLTAVLTMVTFIGEATRAAFDPKKFTRYE